MGYKASPKQAFAHAAFLRDGYKRGVLLFGRQCLAENTLVATPDGYTHVQDLKWGDEVLSYGDKPEYKKIINTWEYLVDTDPKPMIQFIVDNEEVTTTYDHKFYASGQYVPLYQLIWGAMATAERAQLKLLCEQYGAPFDYEEAWERGLDITDEARQRRVWLSENGGRRQDNQDAPHYSSDLDTQPFKETDSEPHKSRQNRQPSGEPRVANTKRKHLAQSQSGQSGEQTGGELWDSHTKGASGVENTEARRDNPIEADSRPIRSVLCSSVGHRKEKDLVSSVRVLPAEKTYAIDVEDNANYCITIKNILVANSGKSYFATQHAWISAIAKQGSYLVVFDTYKHAHQVIWRQYVPLIPKELIYKKNEQELIIEFHYIQGPIKMPWGQTIEVNHDESLPRSSIQLLGSDQADTHRGLKVEGIIFDEYGDQKAENFATVYEPMFTTTGGWAIFLGTPRGYNHFYDMVMDARDNPDWFYLEATWRDSPHVKPEAIELARKDAERKGTLSAFLQEYELEFRSVQGAVYPIFDRKIHVISPKDVPDDLTIYAGIDFGYHTTAFILIGIDKDQNYYVFDEIYARQEILNDIIPRIRQKIGDKRLVLMVGDSANRDAIEVMSKEFPMVPAAKGAGSIIDGIDLVRNLLKPRTQLVGEPKPSMYVSSACRNFIIEMESYKYPEEKKDRNPSDLPLKENDHGLDAYRYVVLHLKHGVQRETDIPTPKVTFNNYGLL